jgi:hypothetical protein
MLRYPVLHERYKIQIFYAHWLLRTTHSVRLLPCLHPPHTHTHIITEIKSQVHKWEVRRLCAYRFSKVNKMMLTFFKVTLTSYYAALCLIVALWKWPDPKLQACCTHTHVHLNTHRHTYYSFWHTSLQPYTIQRTNYSGHKQDTPGMALRNSMLNGLSSCTDWRLAGTSQSACTRN